MRRRLMALRTGLLLAGLAFFQGVLAETGPTSADVTFTSGATELAGMLTLPGGPGLHPTLGTTRGAGPSIATMLTRASRTSCRSPGWPSAYKTWEWRFCDSPKVQGERDHRFGDRSRPGCNLTRPRRAKPIRLRRKPRRSPQKASIRPGPYAWDSDPPLLRCAQAAAAALEAGQSGGRLLQGPVRVRRAGLALPYARLPEAPARSSAR